MDDLGVARWHETLAAKYRRAARYRGRRLTRIHRGRSGSARGPGPWGTRISRTSCEIAEARTRSMTETQAEKILKELRAIKVCVIILTFIIAIASAKATFNL